MKKGNKNVNENLIPTNNAKSTSEDLNFSDAILDNNIKELYLELLQTIKSLTIRPTSVTSKEYITRVANDLFQSNNILFDQFNNNYYSSYKIINTLYEEYKNTSSTSDILYDEMLKELENKLNEELNQITEDLLHFQQQAILDSKNVENDFIPKANFLKYNKKVNKDEYIKIVREINENRINTNQKYLELASDLSSINEQNLLKFKHSIEASIEKNYYDITTLNQDALEKTLSLDQKFETSKENSKNIIATRERKIIQNSIELNELITKISNEYANRIKFAYVPYDIKENKLLDELSENNSSYNKIEGQVLEEFKTLLQQNDNEIDELRQKHRVFKEKYLHEIKGIKKELNTQYQKEIYLINRELGLAAKNYNNNKTKENKELLKILTKKKREFIKAFNKDKKTRLGKVKKEYYIKELNYIERLEKLRTKKSQCEAIKSSAIKNINYERSYHHERINNEIKLNTFEKESYTTTDHYEETMDIYKNHLRVDIENENIRYSINEEELEIYSNDVNTKYEKDKIKANRDYNIDLSKADLQYQKDSINNRINYYNVKTMLEIQKEKIINEFEVLFSNEKMDFERVKNIFYNNCDNIQYELYKADTEIKYKLIDNDLENEINLAEVKKNHSKVIYDINRRSKSINKTYSNNVLRLKLYKDRLEIEKALLQEIYKTYSKSLENIIAFENYMYTSISSFIESDFNENKKGLIIVLEYIRKIKLTMTDNYYNQVISIINDRSEFEINIKFKKQIESIEQEYNEFKTNIKRRIEKNSQTIASYKNTVNTAINALRLCNNNLLKTNMKYLVNLFNKQERNKLLKEINQYNDNKKIIKRQISANKKNINKLLKLEKTLYKERINTEIILNARINNIKKNKFNETKIYSELIGLVKTQASKINTIINDCGSYTSIYKYTYSTLNQTADAINKINSSITSIVKSYFELHYNTYNDKLTNQYQIKKEMYNKNNEKYLKEIEQALSFANKELQTNQTTLTNSYNSKKDLLLSEVSSTKNKLLQELKKLNEAFNGDVNTHNKNMSKISSQKEYELKCHQDNVDMYNKIYNDNNQRIINEYLQNIKKIKLNYNSIINKIESKYKTSLRNIKNLHLSNETLKKSNINNIELEHKEKIRLVTSKIKRTNHEERKTKQTHDDVKKNNFMLYLQNQRNTRKEFSASLSVIERKCQNRIKSLKKEFSKEFKMKKD